MVTTHGDHAITAEGEAVCPPIGEPVRVSTRGSLDIPRVKAWDPGAVAPRKSEPRERLNSSRGDHALRRLRDAVEPSSTVIRVDGASVSTRL